MSLSPVDQGANIDTGSAANETSDPVDAEFPENNQQLADLLSEFDSALNYFEGKVTSGELSVDQAMEMANAAFERKSSRTSSRITILCSEGGKRRRQLWKTS